MSPVSMSGAPTWCGDHFQRQRAVRSTAGWQAAAARSRETHWRKLCCRRPPDVDVRSGHFQVGRSHSGDTALFSTVSSIIQFT